MRRTAFIAALLLSLLLPLPGASAAEDPAPAGQVRLTAFSQGNTILGSMTLDIPQEWGGYWTGAASPLLPAGAEAGEPLESDGEYYFSCDCYILVRTATATKRMPWAVHPSGLLFMARFSDGTSAVLRLPEGFPAAAVSGELRKERVQATRLSPLEFAQWQLGGAPEEQMMEMLSEAGTESWIAEADCRSLVAHETGAGQREALLFAAEAVTRMLAEFHAKHGFYPITLEHLVRGNLAVAPFAPRNPYFWEENVTDDLRPKSATGPGLIYLGLGKSDGGPVVNAGYALGVIGPGEIAGVPPPVSERLKVNAPAAIKWFTSGENPPPLS